MERYRKSAGDDFKYDLDILITELKKGNTEEALQRFDECVNIPQLLTFIAVFVNDLSEEQKGKKDADDTLVINVGLKNRGGRLFAMMHMEDNDTCTKECSVRMQGSGRNICIPDIMIFLKLIKDNLKILTICDFVV